MKNKNTFATSTVQILQKMESTDNPVTRASYRTILGHRIDGAYNEIDKLRDELKDVIKNLNNVKHSIVEE